MTASRATAAELAARARVLAGRSPRTLLGITGAPGAGKTSVAAALVAELGGLCAVVGMDGFHLAQAELERLGRAGRKGAPDTFDAAGYAALLRRLRAAEEPVVYAPLFRRDLEESISGAVPVPSTVPLVITEGNYLLLWPQIRELLDEVWFLDVDDGERRRRLIARRVGLGADVGDASRWALGSDEENARTVIATRQAADLVIRLG